MIGKKLIFDFVVQKGKETFEGYAEKKANEKTEKQPTSNAQDTNKGYGWGKQPSSGSGAGYGWGKQPSPGSGQGYQQTSLEPITADALMTILKLHAQGVDTALITEAVSTKEMRVSQKNVTDYITALKSAGWTLHEKQEDITS